MKVSAHRTLSHRSPWVVFALLVLTLGVYGAVWLRRNARLLNERIPERPISGRFTTTLLVLSVADLVLFIVSLALPEGTFNGVAQPISGLASALLMLGALRVRRRIQYLAEVPGSPPPKVSLLLTIFLNVAYLQLTMNRYSAELEAARWDGLDRPFRDSWRIAWLACLGVPVAGTGVIVLIVAGSFAIDWIGAADFRRERARVAERFGPLSEDRFASAEAELHPVLEVGAALDFSDEEKTRLHALVKGPGPVDALAEQDVRFLEELLERNRGALERAGEVLAPPGRGLGVNYTTEGETPVPPSLVRQIVLAQLIFFDGMFALEKGGAQAAEPSIRQLGALSRVLEGDPNVVSLLLGLGFEHLQLRLLAATIRRCPEPATADTLRGAVLDLPMKDRLREALAYGAAITIWAEKDEIRRYREEQDREEERGVVETVAVPRLVRGGLRYSLAGSLEWMIRHLDAYDAPYATMRSMVEIDPDKLSFLENLRLLGAASHWGLPAKLRAFSDARQGAVVMLSAMADGEGQVCRSLRSRLGAVEDLFQVVEEGPAGCSLRYLRAEEYESAAAGELPGPPFLWQPGCG